MSEVIIIGAGMSGLSCACTLQAAGRKVTVLEAADHIGGRVATDELGGFRFDRGFQVLLTAYPEAQNQLDYKALDLKTIYPGALVRYNRRWHRTADPFRRPLAGLFSCLNPIGSLKDKLLLGQMRLKGFDFSRHPDSRTALETLRAEGFSDSMIERFFRPFLGGIFLETGLKTSVRKMEDVLRNFARGSAAVPANGMGEIPAQLAACLPDGTIRTGLRVLDCKPGHVQLDDGTHMEAGAVVIATDVRAAQHLLGHEGPQAKVNKVVSLYFDAPDPPPTKAMLVLNGDKRGPINNLINLSAVSPAYAPEGRHLISVSVVDPIAAGADDLVDRVRQQLDVWFGPEASLWRHLRTYHIPEAVPAKPVVPAIHPRIEKGLYACGDYSGVASLNTAMVSGRQAAEAVLEEMD
ncbi:MAG: NAD(P)/FAD-dependent oxidoreductase [Puniceicoccaceae bacterium]